MNGEDAMRIGLVNYVVNQNETEDAAYRRSLEIAQCIKNKVNYLSIALTSSE